MNNHNTWKIDYHVWFCSRYIIYSIASKTIENFLLAQSQRLKIVKSARRRFSSHQYRWRKHESLDTCFFNLSRIEFKLSDIHRWIILLKLIYAIIFVCLTISFYLNGSFDNQIEHPKTIFIRILDLWFAFLGLILLFSLFVDRLKRYTLIPFEIIDGIQISLIISFITFVVIGKIKNLMFLLFYFVEKGHIQGYYRIWWSSSTELTHSTLLSIVFLDICPISIVIIITLNSLKKRQSWRRVHANTIISNVWLD